MAPTIMEERQHGRDAGAQDALRASEERCRRLTDELAEVTRTRDEHLATLAHDLRNAIGPLANALYLLRVTAMDPAIRGDALSMAQRQVENIVRLVDQSVGGSAGGASRSAGGAPDTPAPDASARVSAPPVRRVLVVDDNVDSARTMQLLLRKMGNAVESVHDGLAAVEAAAKFAPDVVFLDIGLPMIDGYEAARRIRALPAGRQITLIALTGWAQPEDRRRSLEAGFDHHLVKPVDPGVLKKLLAEIGAAGTR